MIEKADKVRKHHDAVAHNFKNRYIDESQLGKPSEEAVAQSLKTTREKMDVILGVKK